MLAGVIGEWYIDKNDIKNDIVIKSLSESEWCKVIHIYLNDSQVKGKIIGRKLRKILPTVSARLFYSIKIIQSKK